MDELNWDVSWVITFWRDKDTPSKGIPRSLRVDNNNTTSNSLGAQYKLEGDQSHQFKLAKTEQETR